MDLRTFRGSSMAEALAQVKKDLGRDAVILHTRQIKVGGLMGVGARVMVEITASAPEEKLATGFAKAAKPIQTPTSAAAESLGAPRRETSTGVMQRAAAVSDSFEPAAFRRVSRGELAAQPRAAATQPEAIAVADASSNDHSGAEFAQGMQRGTAAALAEPLTARTRPIDPGSLRAIAHEPSQRPAPVRVATPSVTTPIASRTTFAPTGEVAQNAIKDELASIKRLVGQVLQCSRQTALSNTLSNVGAAGAGAAVLALGGMPEALFAEYSRLLEQGVAPEIADLLSGQVRDQLTTAQLQDVGAVQDAMLAAVGRLLPQAEDSWGQGQRVIALIGPTGVGKTTTIAKLAALYKLRDRLKVGLVTADTYRIAAVEQLRTYANIIGLPLRVALTPSQMANEVGALSDCDVVLVDTAGRSQHDQTRLEELRTMVEASGASETHLVLSSAASEGVQRRIVDSFGALSPDRMIFTKLDEAVQLGSIVNLAVRAGRPLSYVTLGQEVPDDIAPAEPRRVARMILEGGAAR